MQFLRRIKLRWINHGIFALIVLVDGYIALTPFLPAVTAAPAPINSAQAAPFVQKITQSAKPSTDQPNQLIIPSLQLDQVIHEGRDTYAELDKGVLRWPDSSTPDRGSNTVLLGHRFTYTNPEGVFYFLDKVQTGDEIGLIWRNIRYTYRVSGEKVVPPSDITILSATVHPTLTIYTCTPTWWPKDRLVITAVLESHS